MDGRWASALPGVLVAISVGTCVLIWMCYADLNFLYYAAMLVASLTMAAGFGLRFQVGQSVNPPRVVVDQLIDVLQSIAPVERVDHETLVADVGKWISIVITVKEAEGGSVVSCHAGLSKRNWQSSLVLTLLFPGAAMIFLVPMALVALRNTVSFATARVVPAVSSSAIVECPVRAGGARELFSEALHEGVSMIWRARRGLVSQYHDRLLVSGIVALIVVLFSILGLLHLGEIRGLDLVEQGLVLPIAGLSGGMTLVSLVLALRWDSMRKIRACDLWAERFASAMSGAELPAASSASGEGSLELLVHAAHEVPTWLKVGDRGEYYREPGLWFPLVYMIVTGSSLMISGILEFGAADLAKLVPLVLGALLVGLSVLVYSWWAVTRRRVNKRATENWVRRAEALRGRMEAYLQGL